MDTSPHKSDFVNVNGIRLHYLDWGGSGPALLFLAGRGCNAHIFDGFAPRFTDHFRVLALTRRGHGESDYPETGYDIDTLTDDIRQFLDRMHIERAFLVQHSNEGIELAHFANRYPERVQKLVFLEPAWDRNSAGFKAWIEKWPVIESEYPDENGAFRNFADFSKHQQTAFTPNASSWCEAREEDLRHQVTIGPEGKVVYKGTEAIHKAIRQTLFGLTPDYAKIQAPTLAIFPMRGRNYYVAPFMNEAQREKMVEFYDAVQLPFFQQCVAEFRMDVPHARIVELPDSHTYFFITQEERVYNEMMEFLLEQ